MIIELATNYGTMYVPDNDGGQYWWLANTGAAVEDEFIEVVTELLDEREHGVAIDVGANFGCWSLALIGHATRVMAYEPQAVVCELLRRSRAAHPQGHLLTVSCMAAGAQLGLVAVPVLDIETSADFGGVSLLERVEEHAPVMSVPVVPLDHELSADERVSFIKVDVEGGENAVLSGARDLIGRWKPILFVECDHRLTDEDGLRVQIEAMGYAADKYWGNFLCMPT